MEGQNIQYSDSKVTEYKTPITSAKTPLMGSLLWGPRRWLRQTQSTTYLLLTQPNTFWSRRDLYLPVVLHYHESTGIRPTRWKACGDMLTLLLSTCARSINTGSKYATVYNEAECSDSDRDLLWIFSTSMMWKIAEYLYEIWSLHRAIPI